MFSNSFILSLFLAVVPLYGSNVESNSFITTENLIIKPTTLPLSLQNNESFKNVSPTRRGLGGKKAMHGGLKSQKKGAVVLSNLNRSELDSLSSVSFQFFDDEDPISFDEHNSRSEGTGFYWHGMSGSDDRSFNILIQEDGSVTGSLSIGTDVYSLQTLPDGTVIVQEIPDSEFPPEVGIEDEIDDRRLSLRGASDRNVVIDNEQAESRSLQSGSDDGSTIDVLCLYTREAVCELAFQQSNCDIKKYEYMMKDKCQLAVEETNTAFSSSGINTQVRQVYSGYVGDDFEQNENLCLNVKYMAQGQDNANIRIRELREEYAADLVGLVVSNKSLCGCAYKYDGNTEKAFFASNYMCMTGHYTFSHEMGHTMGCEHDRSDYDVGSNYAYIKKNSFRTIMSIECSDSSCPRIQRFSSNSSSFKYGKDMTGDNDHNNAAQINQTRYNVANFRTSLDNNQQGPSPTKAPTPKKANGDSPSSTPPNGSNQTGNEDCTPVTIVFKTDNKPQDITWKIMSLDTDVDTPLRKSDSYTKPNQVIKEEECVPNGECYKVVLIDQSFDGLKGNQIDVLVNGVREGPDGNFKKYSVTKFCT